MSQMFYFNVPMFLHDFCWTNCYRWNPRSDMSWISVSPHSENHFELTPQTGKTSWIYSWNIIHCIPSGNLKVDYEKIIKFSYSIIISIALLCCKSPKSMEVFFSIWESHIFQRWECHGVSLGQVRQVARSDRSDRSCRPLRLGQAEASWAWFWLVNGYLTWWNVNG